MEKKRITPIESSDFEAMYMDGLAIDAVIFGFHDQSLKILLLEYENTGLFALPAGFIKKEEDLNNAARRVVLERTGLDNIYLDQFYVFGDRSRHDPAPLQKIMKANGIDPHVGHWLLRRFLTIGYYALVDYTLAMPNPDLLSDRCNWYELDRLPELMLDHKDIVQKALETLRASLDQKLIGFNLMPETFTMHDLQSLYETVLGEKLLRTSFQRKMLNLKILERIEKKYGGGAHKAPYLYGFKEKKTAVNS